MPPTFDQPRRCRSTAVWLATLLLMTGCASMWGEPPTEGPASLPPATAPRTLDEPPSDTPAANAQKTVTPPLPGLVRADGPQPVRWSATNALGAVTPPLPRPVRAGPKPWRVVLEHGSRQAFLDGVLVWLSEPAIMGTEKRPKAVYLDQRTTLDPILQAPTGAVTRTRPPRVFLDPGHGGHDPGALSYCGTHRESALVLDITRRLSTYLTRAGYEVRLARTDDGTFLELEDRPAIAAAWQADLFVSIHLNAAPDAQARGIETYVLPPPGVRTTAQNDLENLSASAWAALRKTYPGNGHGTESLRLAFCIQRRLLATTGLEDRGLRRARFTVLREATMPAVLVEGGFLSNRQESAFLATPNGRERIARGIYQGILDYALGQVAPGFPAPAVVPALQLVTQ